MESPLNFVRDPSSNQFSASRLLLCSTLIIGVPALLVLVVKGMFPPKDAVNLALGITASLAGIYAVNSGASAYGRTRFKGEMEKEENEAKKPGMLNEMKESVEILMKGK